MNKTILLLITLVFVTGCSEPKINASSEESMKSSVEKVRNSLTQSKRQEFDNAIQIIAFNQFDMQDLIRQSAVGAGNIEEKIRLSLDGKTGDQIIQEADRIRADRAIREHQQALEEINELEALRIKSEIAREELNKFQVLRSRFYLRDEGFSRKQPIIELTVKNLTESPISRAYFEGTLASPDRSVPWIRETFNYSISGGLEPNEEVTWNLAPNMFSDWGKVNAPADAIFTVTVEQLDGVDGNPIFSTRAFTERELLRLNELKKKFATE